MPEKIEDIAGEDNRGARAGAVFRALSISHGEND